MHAYSPNAKFGLSNNTIFSLKKRKYKSLGKKIREYQGVPRNLGKFRKVELATNEQAIKITT